MKKEPEFYVAKLNFLYKKYYKLFKEYFGWNYEDFKQELFIVYLKAEQNYSPNRKASFDTYVIHCMKNYIVDTYRKTIRQIRAPFNCGQDKYHFENLVNEFNESRYLISGANPEEILNMKDLHRDNLEKLTKLERKIYTLLTSNSADIKSICQYLNISKKELDKSIDSIKERLQSNDEEES